MAISRLNSLGTLSGGDQIPIGSLSSGDDRRVSLTDVLSYMQSNLTFGTSVPTTQYAAPSATAFNVAITDGSSNIHLILTPVAAYAAGTITLPSSTNAVDKQTVLVNSTKAVTTLTIDGNGATAVTGEPTTIAENDFFTLKYDAITSTWYRVG